VPRTLGGLGGKVTSIGREIPSNPLAHRNRVDLVFSHKDFEENTLNSGVEDTQKSYLSLGDSIAECQIKTADLTGLIYRELIEDAREVFTTGSSEPTSYREVEVLAGGLALLISRRLARSEQQLRC